MGKLDIGISDWLKDKERFADLFNGLLFDGEPVVRKDELVLMPIDTKMIVKSKGRGKKKQRKWIEKYRDVMMRWEGITLAFLAIENQDKVNYQMPVRTMLYDALSYSEQAANMWKSLKQKEREAVSPAEFVSRYRAGDKLTPMITLVLYYGENDEWDGPLQLYDMFDMPLNTRANDVLKRYVPDYRINLIELEKIDYKKFTTDLQIMFGMLKYRKDKVLLARYIEENRNYFANLDEDTLEAGVALLGFKGVIVDRLQQLWEAGEKEKIKNKDGGYDMCKAIMDMMSDSKEKGREEGREEGRLEGYRDGEIIGTIKAYKEMEVSKGETIKRIIVKFQLTEDSAWDMVQKCWG